MTWVKVDDLFADHPKLLALERDRLSCMGLWLIGMCYSARHLTDGYVPAAVLPRGTGRLAERLVQVGLWTKKEGGYQIHDYDEYQPTKQYVLEQRAKTNTRVKRWRSSVSNGVGNTTNVPNTSRTDPVPISFSSSPLPPKAGLHDGHHGKECVACFPLDAA